MENFDKEIKTEQTMTQVGKSKNKRVREPLNNQSKAILFGMLGGFFLLGAIALITLMFIF